mmetsp:Transcript_9805/g.30261  ORF Transcript_9805/g.30261 Transcript_9805/m.30261 type:complete len:202 (-) Transcript_9805:292-897(-)
MPRRGRPTSSSRPAAGFSRQAPMSTGSWGPAARAGATPSCLSARSSCRACRPSTPARAAPLPPPTSARRRSAAASRRRSAPARASSTSPPATDTPSSSWRGHRPTLTSTAPATPASCRSRKCSRAATRGAARWGWRPLVVTLPRRCAVALRSPRRWRPSRRWTTRPSTVCGRRATCRSLVAPLGSSRGARGPVASSPPRRF